MKDTKKVLQMNKTEITPAMYGQSDKFRKEIHELIPGGAHTYSKGDDQFPKIAPAAIERGRGAWLWDIDGNRFLDCSMGLTSVTLGHAFEPVLERVRIELEKGVNFQRPSIIEKEMAEKFLALVPQHQMIKFAKNGSIVTTAAVKLARAYTGRKLVAFPIDHPFYSYDDWFIGKTACDKGVPEEITALSVTFKACNLDSLKALFDLYPNQIACVITEPEKNFEGDTTEFLRQAIDLCHQNGALFIIDEMITGFKTAFPGSITKYKLDADMATWGKSTANGFSFCALTGKKDIMQLGGINIDGQEKLFLISTTHGGETHTIGAGLATIDFYERNNVVEKNQYTGQQIINNSREIIRRHGLDKQIQVSDTNWMVAFAFNGNDGVASSGLRTLFMQEMIRQGVLFQGVFVPCYSHDAEEQIFFLDAFDQACGKYSKALHKGYEDFLVGSPAKAVFRKLV
jgi:glutamate-1-semialdehyde 2,1-aminomutase